MILSSLKDSDIIKSDLWSYLHSFMKKNKQKKAVLVAYILNETDADAIVVQNELLPKVVSIKNRFQIMAKVFVTEHAVQCSTESLEDIMTKNDMPLEIHRTIDPGDPAFIFFSSGTTGNPKGIVHTHQSFCMQAYEMSQTPLYPNLREETTIEHHVTSFTLAHIGGCVRLYMVPTILGDCFVTVDYTEFEGVIEAIERYKIQRAYMRPFLIAKLAVLDDAEKKLASLKYVVTAGSFPDKRAQIDLNQRLPALKFYDLYGLTESMIVSMTPGDGEIPVGGGQPMQGCSLCIKDLTSNKSFKPMNKGMLMVKAPWVMKEYKNKPKETEEMFDSNNWFITGDVDYFTEDNRLHIIGRDKDIIMVNGAMVLPTEIEQRICMHKCVLDAAVIGAASVEKGQVAKAFVIPKNNKISETEVEEFVNTRTENINERIYGGVCFVDSFPRNSSGKVLKNELRRLDWRESH